MHEYTAQSLDDAIGFIDAVFLSSVRNTSLMVTDKAVNLHNLGDIRSRLCPPYGRGFDYPRTSRQDAEPTSRISTCISLQTYS